MTRNPQLGLVLVGPPGVGKGTQALRIRDEFALDHIATGDLLREHRARDTELGRQATQFMTTGRLVPDELVLAVVGPGFITANVDNDAGGIWTYSVAGAQFGYTLLWAMIPTTIAGSLQNVGGHSEASSTPSRPEVPAPT